MQWLMQNWQSVLLAVLAVDAALIPIFPQVQLLVKVKNFLSGMVPPKIP